jgi:hypothetical protein
MQTITGDSEVGRECRRTRPVNDAPPMNQDIDDYNSCH